MVQWATDQLAGAVELGHIQSDPGDVRNRTREAINLTEKRGGLSVEWCHEISSSAILPAKRQ